ncbi:hypothetical protein QQP08_027349 [Theobroma cacao]|nr:hypothetical protein QQP08_027349 [Theobroma cacao]
MPAQGGKSLGRIQTKHIKLSSMEVVAGRSRLVRHTVLEIQPPNVGEVQHTSSNMSIEHAKLVLQVAALAYNPKHYNFTMGKTWSAITN